MSPNKDMQKIMDHTTKVHLLTRDAVLKLYEPKNDKKRKNTTDTDFYIYLYNHTILPRMLTRI